MIESSGKDIKTFGGEPASEEATHFASAGRSSPDVVRQQAVCALGDPLLVQVFDSLQEMTLLLNSDRQIVFANRAFCRFRGDGDSDAVLGMRPGEAVGCLHARAEEAPNGCGTSAYCRACGAVLAILASQQNGSGQQEVRIVRHDDAEALNLCVRTRQLELSRGPFTLFAIEDVSDQRRREELENVFFHDVLDIAAELRALVRQLPVAPLEHRAALRRQVVSEINRLISDTDARRLVAKAERNELSCTFALIDARDLLETCQFTFLEKANRNGRTLVLDPQAQSMLFESDWNLTTRVVASMIEDAVETAPSAGTITLGCRAEPGHVCIEVRHPFVAARTEPEVFQPSSFANTRSRGLGIYGMRVIVERYLKGRVAFASDDVHGTVFAAWFPAGDREKAP